MNNENNNQTSGKFFNSYDQQNYHKNDNVTQLNVGIDIFNQSMNTSMEQPTPVNSVSNQSNTYNQPMNTSVEQPIPVNNVSNQPMNNSMEQPTPVNNVSNQPMNNSMEQPTPVNSVSNQSNTYNQQMNNSIEQPIPVNNVSNQSNIYNQPMNNSMEQPTPVNSVSNPPNTYNQSMNTNIQREERKLNKQSGIKKVFNKKIVSIIFVIIFSIVFLKNVTKNLLQDNVDYDEYIIEENIDYEISETTNIIDNTTNNDSSEITDDTTNNNSNDITDNTIGNNSVQSKISRTIMIYMVGSNLESDILYGGNASADINEILKANPDNNTNIYIYTGGAKIWYEHGISNTRNSLYKVNNSKLEFVKDFGPLNMGLSTTLTSYLNYVQGISKTDEYSLIFWDHGGGPVFGFGSDELNDGDSLNLNELYTALKNSKFNQSNKLEFIGFDACLMGNVEIAYYLKDFANYLVASEETEPGTGWDYSFLTNASSMSTLDLTKKIVDTYVSSVEKYAELYSMGYTLSIVDLTKINNLVNNINNSFDSLNKNLSTNYEDIAKIRTKSLEFGKGTPEESYDLIDLNSFIQLYEGEDFKQLKNILNETVIYSKSNLPNASGLSIYFPYTNKLLAQQVLPIYKIIFTNFGEYNDFITNFNSIQTGNVRNSFNLKQNNTSFKNNKLTMKLTEEQAKNYNKASYIIFEKQEDGNFTIVNTGTNFKLKDNILTAKYDKKIIKVHDESDNSSSTVQLIHVKDTNLGTLFYAPVTLFNTKTEVKNGYVRLLVKGDKIVEKGIVPMTENIKDDVKTKMVYNLKDWDEAQFPYFKHNILDKNGKYTDDWETIQTFTAFSVNPKKNKISFKMTDLDKNKEYYAVIRVSDLQNNIYSSDLIKIK